MAIANVKLSKQVLYRGLGVDIEKIDRFNTVVGRENLIKKILAREEIETYNKYKKAEYQSRFLCQRWCLKEAIFKALPDDQKRTMDKINISTVNNRPVFELHPQFEVFLSCSYANDCCFAACFILENAPAAKVKDVVSKDIANELLAELMEKERLAKMVHHKSDVNPKLVSKGNKKPWTDKKNSSKHRVVSKLISKQSATLKKKERVSGDFPQDDWLVEFETAESYKNS